MAKNLEAKQIWLTSTISQLFKAILVFAFIGASIFFRVHEKIPLSLPSLEIGSKEFWTEKSNEYTFVKQVESYFDNFAYESWTEPELMIAPHHDGAHLFSNLIMYKNASD